MNKIILLICFVGLIFSNAYAQPKVQPKPAPVRPTTPPGPRMPPPQYVLKKDFEPKIQELENKVRSAVNAGASARNNVAVVQDSVNQIGAKVLDIETLLNSANFKISLNSDSLKSTQARIDEVRVEMDRQATALKAENDKAFMMIYILFGLCILLPALVYYMMISADKKSQAEIRNYSERMSADIQKNYISQQDEIKKIKSNLEGDVYNAKADMNMHLTRDRDANTAQFKKLQQLIDNKADKPVEESAEESTES